MKLVDLFVTSLIQDTFILCIWHDDTFDLIKIDKDIDFNYGYPMYYSDTLITYLNSKVIYLTTDPDTNLIKIGIDF